MTKNNSNECPLLRMNNDCIYEIYEFLTVADWCSLRKTCTRLQKISDHWFQQQYKSSELIVSFEPKTIVLDIATQPYIRSYRLNKKYYYTDFLEHKTLIQLLIHNFGHLISKITVARDISKYIFDNEERVAGMMKYLNRYCTSVKKLKLVNIPLNLTTFVQCGGLFLNLHRLVVDHCLSDDETLRKCLDYCRSLKEFELLDSYQIEGNSLAHEFHSLESIAIKACGSIKGDVVQRFCRRNPQLKSLTIMKCKYIDYQIFQHISDNLPNLEALALCFDFSYDDTLVGRHLTQLLRLTKLKKLEIGFAFTIDENQQVSDFLSDLAARNQIETLHLCRVRVDDELTRSLCKFTALKTLKFSSATLDANVSEKLATELSDLLEIYINPAQRTTTLTELNAFLEYSTTLKKIVFLPAASIPLLTEDVLPVVEVLQRKSYKKRTHFFLHLYRDHKDNFEMHHSWNNLLEQADNMKLLAMAVEEKLAYLDTGNWLWIRNRRRC